MVDGTVGIRLGVVEGVNKNRTSAARLAGLWRRLRQQAERGRRAVKEQNDGPVCAW